MTSNTKQAVGGRSVTAEDLADTADLFAKALIVRRCELSLEFVAVSPSIHSDSTRRFRRDAKTRSLRKANLELEEALDRVQERTGTGREQLRSIAAGAFDRLDVAVVAAGGAA